MRERTPNKITYQDSEIIKIELISKKNGNKECIIDNKNYYKVKHLHWSVGKNKNSFYCFSINRDKNKKRITSIHRLILGETNRSNHIDHINNDGLDNRERNLRQCSYSENNRNRNKHNRNTSGYKGVSYSKTHKKYNAQICVDSKRISLGYFNSKNEAAREYNKAATKYFGEFAKLNFLEEQK